MLLVVVSFAYFVICKLSISWCILYYVFVICIIYLCIMYYIFSIVYYVLSICSLSILLLLLLLLLCILLFASSGRGAVRLLALRPTGRGFQDTTYMSLSLSLYIYIYIVYMYMVIGKLNLLCDVIVVNHFSHQVIVFEWEHMKQTITWLENSQQSSHHMIVFSFPTT